MASRIGRQRQSKSPSGWSSLPDDILEEIFKLMTDFTDHVGLRCVCAPWRAFLLKRNTIIPQLHRSNSPPRLMLVGLPYDHTLSDNDPPKDCPSPTFFSLSNNEIHPMDDIPNNAHCCGFSQGWLCLLDNSSPTMYMLNPFTRAQIQLPPITTFPGVLGFNFSDLTYTTQNNNQLSLNYVHSIFIHKVVLSPNPTSTNYLAVAIIGRRELLLAVCKSGQNKWTLVPDIIGSTDIIHYKGQFYTFDSFGRLFVICNLDDGFLPLSPIANQLVPPLLFATYPNKVYLAELSGELILVVRRVSLDKEDTESGSFTKLIQVYRLDQGLRKWKAKKSIDGHVLFLSRKSVLAATDSPHSKANCIYFTEDLGAKDYGMFNLETKLFEQFPCTVSLLSPRRPIWIAPSLC